MDVIITWVYGVTVALYGLILTIKPDKSKSYKARLKVLLVGLIPVINTVVFVWGTYIGIKRGIAKRKR